MRILISADMEGATGVTHTDDVVPGTEPWQRFRRLFTEDVNACARGLYAAGASEVLVNEAHSSQRNLLLEQLDERARMLTGRHKPLSMMQGIADGFAGVVFLGYHTGAGEQGVLAHTYMENSITGVWLDHVSASEGRLNAALAAEHGVPVLLVTGDDQTCADATGYAPHAQRVAVKEAVSRYAAICDPPAQTASRIASAATKSMTRAGKREAELRSHHVRVEFDAAHLAAACEVIPTVRRLGARCVEFDTPNMTEAMRCFKVVTIVAGSAIQGKYG